MLLKIKSFILGALCALPLCEIWGQNAAESSSPWNFHFQYGLGIEEFIIPDTIPVRNFQLPEDRQSMDEVFYTSWLFHSFTTGVEYKPVNFLSAELNLGYAGGGYSKTFNEGTALQQKFTSLQMHDFRVQPVLNLDLFRKRNDRSLNLGVGVTAYYRRQQVGYWNEADSLDEPLLYLEMLRSGMGANAFFEIEWGNYLTPRFGYSVGFRWVATYNFRPRQLQISEYLLNGQPTTRQGKSYSYSENPDFMQSLPQESFSMKAIYISIGMKYRL